jgi:hypothetical protein
MKTYRCYVLVAEIQAQDKEEARTEVRKTIRTDTIVVNDAETAIVVKRQRQRKGEWA